MFANWTHDGDALLRPDQRARPSASSTSTATTRRLRPHARLPGRRGLRARRHLRRRHAGSRFEKTNIDRRQRHLPLERRDEGDDAHLEAQGRRDLRAGDVRPGLAVALLPDQRRRPSSRACGATSSRRGKTEDVEKADWDIAWTFFSHERQVPRHRRQRGRAHGRSRSTTAGRAPPLPLPALPAGEISSVRVSRSETRLAFELDGDRGPNNLYVYEFGAQGPGAADGHDDRRTSTRPTSSRPRSSASSRSTAWQIPNIFYKPYQATPEAKAPALVWVHGGPGGQTRRQYSAVDPVPRQPRLRRPRHQQPRQLRLRQDLQHRRRPQARPRAAVGLRRGQEVPAEPAVRGPRPHRHHRRQLRRLHGPRGARVPARGVRRSGVDIFGVSNWVRTLESIPQYWESQRLALYKEIGDPEKDRDFLNETSPLFHADKIRKPLLVLQGANDPRVIKPESDDIVAAVKKNGVPVEYVVFPDEGHGFTKKKNQIEAWSAILEVPRQVPEGRAGGEGGRLDEHARGAGAASWRAYAAHARARRSTPSLHRVGVEHVGDPEAVGAAAAGRRERSRNDGDAVAQRDLRERVRVSLGQLHPEREAAGRRRPTSSPAGAGRAASSAGRAARAFRGGATAARARPRRAGARRRAGRRGSRRGPP